MAKSAFEQASGDDADAKASIKRAAVGLAYLSEALIDMSADLQELKSLLNKARKDRNEISDRATERRRTDDPGSADPQSR